MNAIDLNKNLTAGDWHSLTNKTVNDTTFPKAVVSTAFSKTKVIAEVWGSEADMTLLAAAPLLAWALRNLVNAALAAGLNDTPHSDAVQSALRALEKAGTPRPRPVAPPPLPLSDAAFKTVEQVVSSVHANSSGRAFVRTEIDARTAADEIRRVWPSMPYGTSVSVSTCLNGWVIHWTVRGSD